MHFVNQHYTRTTNKTGSKQTHSKSHFTIQKILHARVLLFLTTFSSKYLLFNASYYILTPGNVQYCTDHNEIRHSRMPK